MNDPSTLKADRDACGAHLATDRLIVTEQAGAICLRQRSDIIEVLLVASLRTGRWGIPKGHVEQDETTRTAAEREAFEEGGVRGIVSGSPIGSYFYSKPIDTGTFHVRVYLIEVKDHVQDYPEKALRRARWVPLETAANVVSRRGLRKLFRDLRCLGVGTGAGFTQPLDG